MIGTSGTIGGGPYGIASRDAFAIFDTEEQKIKVVGFLDTKPSMMNLDFDLFGVDAFASERTLKVKKRDESGPVTTLAELFDFENTVWFGDEEKASGDGMVYYRDVSISEDGTWDKLQFRKIFIIRLQNKYRTFADLQCAGLDARGYGVGTRLSSHRYGLVCSVGTRLSSHRYGLVCSELARARSFRVLALKMHKLLKCTGYLLAYLGHGLAASVGGRSAVIYFDTAYLAKAHAFPEVFTYDRHLLAACDALGLRGRNILRFTWSVRFGAFRPGRNTPDRCPRRPR